MIQHEPAVLHYQALQGRLSLILALAKRYCYGMSSQMSTMLLLTTDVDIYINIKLLVFTVGPLQKPRTPPTSTLLYQETTLSRTWLIEENPPR